jgi:hypothetical protein
MSEVCGYSWSWSGSHTVVSAKRRGTGPAVWFCGDQRRFMRASHHPCDSFQRCHRTLIGTPGCDSARRQARGSTGLVSAVNCLAGAVGLNADARQSRIRQQRSAGHRRAACGCHNGRQISDSGKHQLIGEGCAVEGVDDDRGGAAGHRDADDGVGADLPGRNGA